MVGMSTMMFVNTKNWKSLPNMSLPLQQNALRPCLYHSIHGMKSKPEPNSISDINEE